MAAYTKRREAMQNAAMGVAIVWEVELVNAYACLECSVAHPSVEVVFTSHDCGGNGAWLTRLSVSRQAVVLQWDPRYQASVPQISVIGFGILDDNRIITHQIACIRDVTQEARL